MKRLLDNVRAILISTELLCLVIPIGFWTYWPTPAELVAAQIGGDLRWGFGATLVPLGLLAKCYQLGTDVLSPQGSRKVLLDWPNYWMLKNRIIIALIFCILAFLISLAGLYWIAEANSSFGATLIISGWLSSAAAIASVALARWKIRELLGE